MSELTTAGLVVGVEAEACNKTTVQMKEEMEEPKEAAVNKREGSSELERHVCSGQTVSLIQIL